MSTRKAFIARRKKLANFLQSLPAKNFDIGNWNVLQYDCGTSACGIGWCPKVFPKYWMLYDLTPGLLDQESDFQESGFVNPHLDARLFFGLSIGDEHYCFSPTHLGITAKEVARRLLGAE